MFYAACWRIAKANSPLPESASGCVQVLTVCRCHCKCKCKFVYSIMRSASTLIQTETFQQGKSILIKMQPLTPHSETILHPKYAVWLPKYNNENSSDLVIQVGPVAESEENKKEGGMSVFYASGIKFVPGKVTSSFVKGFRSVHVTSFSRVLVLGLSLIHIWRCRRRG